MKLSPANLRPPAANPGGGRCSAPSAPRRRAARGPRRRGQAGFTLAEVLAALLFMAIVIPVAIEGLQIASRAGVLSERKGIAVRLADSKLNELVATGQWQSASQRGTIEEGWQTYQWQMSSDPWSEDSTMRELKVTVTVSVQGRDYPVSVSTLVDATQ